MYVNGILASDVLAGMNDGPVVLFNKSGYSIVISSNDHFTESTQTSNNAIYGIGFYGFSPKRNDSVLCFNNECYNSNKQLYYKNNKAQGFAFNPNNYFNYSMDKKLT